MYNGDNKLNLFQKIIWLISNYFNNLNFQKCEEHFWYNLELNTKTLTSLLSQTNPCSSPSRRSCDIFWLNFPWKKVTKLLGGKISAIEVGCGRGRYGIMLENLIKNFSYLGCDIQSFQEWENRQKANIHFRVLNSDDILSVIKNKNFLFTQSAVEHFENDNLFFKNIQNYVNQQSKPFLQIHMVPSASCLWKYLTHGYRQYSPSSILNLYDKFWKKEQFFSFSLGGKNCNKLHIKYITLPMVMKKEDKRKKEFKNYKIDLNKAISIDFQTFDPKNASFYALVIFSNVKLGKNFF